MNNLKLELHKSVFRGYIFVYMYVCLHTANILVVSDLDLRASRIGDNDSSNISWAFSPGPVVSANSPT